MAFEFFIKFRQQAVLASFFVATAMTFSAQALIMGVVDIPDYPEGEVILERPRDLNKSYRERRGATGSHSAWVPKDFTRPVTALF